MKITAQQVARIAALARLEPGEGAVLEAHARDFARILELVQTLESFPHEAESPLCYPVGSRLRQREDTTRADCGSGPGDNAPAVQQGYYLVPRFME